jgi:hypothetical protein
LGHGSRIVERKGVRKQAGCILFVGSGKSAVNEAGDLLTLYLGIGSKVVAEVPYILFEIIGFQNIRAVGIGERIVADNRLRPRQFFV